MSEEKLLYGVDLASGMRVELGKRTLSEREIVDFAREWDPLPIHTDPAIAEKGPFGGLTASGIHTMAIATKMMSEGFTMRTAVIAGRGLRRLELLKPVRPGTELTGTLEVVETELRDDGTAITLWRVELADAEAETLLAMLVEAVVRGRPGSAPRRDSSAYTG